MYHIQSYINRGDIYYRRALDTWIAGVGSELPLLLPGLASQYPSSESESDFDSAYYDFDTAYYLDKSNVAAYVSFMQFITLFGDYDYVAQGYHPAYDEAEPKSDSAGVFAVRGWAYRERGDYDEAITDFTRAIELDPNSPLFYRDRGIARYLNGDYDRAIADYDTVIASSPDDEYLYMFRGLAYHMRGEHDRAVSDYDRAIGVNPDDPYFYFFRSVTHDELGNNEQSKEDTARLEYAEYDIPLALRLLGRSHAESLGAAAD